jgi:Beta-lactamase enzyme family
MVASPANVAMIGSQHPVRHLTSICCSSHGVRPLWALTGTFAGVVVLAALAFTAASAAVPPICASARNPQTAARLGADILAARAGRTSTIAVGVSDTDTGVSCRLDADRRFDSASIVKVTILGALLRRAEEQGRSFTRDERRLAQAMITRSDNASASSLWRRLGRAGIRHFLRLAGLRATVPGPNGYWGLTQTSVRDQLRVLSLLSTPNRVLNQRSRVYALALMRRVVPGQRWGMPAGAPAGVTIALKNGWLPRATHGWRIHSIGTFVGDHHTYHIAVLSQNNPTMAYGIATLERIARIIHRDLNPGPPPRHVGDAAFAPMAGPR